MKNLKLLSLIFAFISIQTSAKTDSANNVIKDSPELAHLEASIRLFVTGHNSASAADVEKEARDLGLRLADNDGKPLDLKKAKLQFAGGSVPTIKVITISPMGTMTSFRFIDVGNNVANSIKTLESMGHIAPRTVGTR